ncbi:unnamed protein product, partial [Ranitomeya imitator]
IRSQLIEQGKCIDAQVEHRQQLLQELSEFLRRKAEINLEYSRNLEKLCDRFSSKIRNSKEHHRKDQPLLSPINCLYMVLNHTRQESRDYAAISDVYSSHLIPRLTHTGEDLIRLTKKIVLPKSPPYAVSLPPPPQSKDISAQQQEDLMKLVSELQGLMRRLMNTPISCLLLLLLSVEYNSQHSPLLLLITAPAPVPGISANNTAVPRHRNMSH